MDYKEQVELATAYIQGIHSDQVAIGIILGTGLGNLASQIEVDLEIPYQEIPHFPLSTVESHSGTLLFGRLGGKKVVAMKGRFHYYEGYSMKEVTFPIRVMRLLGVQTLFVSNASGGLNPNQEVGEVMVIADHINLFPENPLRGKNYEAWGPRFPDMSVPYSPRLIDLALRIAHDKGLKLHTGVYCGVEGPNLETPAEYNYLRTIGGDAVGMSTVPEVLVACHAGMEVFGISAITDLGVEGKIHQVTLDDVLAAAAKAEPIMSQILAELLRRM
ncbi:MAG: purine-nucleoside phosphorylase [Algoriphagus sp.]|jgi:purine-nucleoside phosphorylase|uniref:purine-nucleoside phosphorylase n=1 Tax=Algoriphagus sp. TaxID=1872435 RepID=UPI002746EA3B|nr:purine-nucleoside phosphorylase [Algoriphagus sp.]MDP4746825.1 purine-nucleoside phosphorylase [Algoriphagus sp.]